MYYGYYELQFMKDLGKKDEEVWFEPALRIHAPLLPPPLSPIFYVSLFNTYLLTSWCRVLLEKLTGLQLIKKFPAFHGTRRFITALTSVRHLSLS